MSTVAEIKGALPSLSNDELKEVEASLREQYRARKIGVIYDDAYGIWTEEDQISAAAEVFSMLLPESRSFQSPGNARRPGSKFHSLPGKLNSGQMRMIEESLQKWLGLPG